MNCAHLFSLGYFLLAVPSGGNWGISSIFNGNEAASSTRSNWKDATITKHFNEPISNLEPAFATIQLREVKFICLCYILLYMLGMWCSERSNIFAFVMSFCICCICYEFSAAFALFLNLINMFQPPAVLRATDAQSEQDSVEISITRLLIKSYYDIVRKNIQDGVPKAIMHFLVIFV